MGPFMVGSFHGRLLSRHADSRRNSRSLSISERHYHAWSLFFSRKKDDFVDCERIIIFSPRDLFGESS